MFVKKRLQEMIDDVFNKEPRINEFNLFLDSGTTITPTFQFVLDLNIHNDRDHHFNIYTNNLAGIDEIHKITSLSEYNLNERDFILIPGQPLNKYRATTGQTTQKFLNSIWDEQAEQKKKKKKILNVCVLTANWFILRKGYRRIAICARGSGHMDFKINLIENCDYIFLLSPLGKLLPFESVNNLNDLLPKNQDKYEFHEIPVEKRDRTFLVTSYRQKNSASPLLNFSEKLKNITGTENYTLCKMNPKHKLKCERSQVEEAELPHEYIRENYRQIF